MLKSLLTHRQILAKAVLLTFLGTNFAAAACYADYKAKQDDPLRLHYGVIEVDDAACATGANPAPEIAARIAVEDWTLLNVLSVFGESGLEEKRESAGEYYLRY